MTEKPLKIWFNALHSKAGGGLTYLFNMAPLLAAMPGVELTVIAAPTQSVPEGVARLAPPNWALHFGFLLAEQAWLPAAAYNHGVDVIYSPANYGPLWGPGLVLLLSNSIAVGKLERRWSKRLYWAAIAAATWASLKRCDAAMAVSSSIREELAGRRSSKAVTIVPHGVAARFSASDQGREEFVLAVGDIYIQKNFGRLVQAFALIAGQFPHLMLKIAGTILDEDYKASLEEIITRAGMTGRVNFLGRVGAEDLVDLYRRCRLFVFPSLAESFGMPILEAMACGAPVVCSDVSAMPEIAGGAGVLADCRDPQALALAMSAVLSNPILASELSAAGIKHAARFTWEQSATQTADVLRQVAEKRC